MQSGTLGGGLVVWQAKAASAADRRVSAEHERRVGMMYVLERLEPRVLLSAGDLDARFGVGGKVVAGVPGYDFSGAVSAIVLDDGKVLVGGRVVPPAAGGASLALARFNADGSLDTTFGDGGYTVLGDGDVAGNGMLKMALDGDGNILVATDVHHAGQMSDFALYRFNADGAIDASFGDGGVAETDVSPWDIPQSLDVLDDGSIVVGGYAETLGWGLKPNGRANDLIQGVVMRFDADGTPDAGFGDGGVVVVDPSSDMDWVMGRAVVNADGDIYFVGNTSNLITQQGHAILRQIGDDGTVTSLPFGDVGDDNLKFVKDAKIDSEGRIVMLLTSADGSHLARLNADGTADDGFGSGGWVDNDFAVNPYATIHVAADDSIILAGQEADQEGVFTLAHYLSDGSIDASFGNGGAVDTAFASGHGEQVRDVVFTADDKIVAVGGNTDNHQHESKFLIARYDAADWGVAEQSRGGGSSSSSGSQTGGDEGGDSAPVGGDSAGEDEGGGPGSGDGGSGGPSLASPFSVASVGGDGSLFGKDDDLLGQAGELF